MLHDASLMTTVADVLAPQDEPVVAQRRRPRLWLRVFVGFTLGFLLAVGVAAGGLLAYDANHQGRVLGGVAVGGVDLSGLDQAQAAAALHAEFDRYGDGHVLIRTTAGDVEVRYDEFGRRPDVDAMVADAMVAGRTGTTLERAVSEVRLALEPISLQARLTLDESTLAARIGETVRNLGRAPVDSSITMDKRGPVVTPAVPGRAFDDATAAATAIEAVRHIDAPAEIVVEPALTVIPAEHGDGEALAAKAAADRMVADVVVRQGTKEWTIKAWRVRAWIHFEKNASGAMWPVVDQGAIPSTLTKVSKAVRRDPVSATYLKSKAGRIVGVVAGKDGRRLDAKGTVAAIIAAVMSRGDGAIAEAVKVKMVTVQPKLTTAAALQKGPLMERLGTWKTWFPVSERNYFGANIWLPAKIIDGTVLMPGQSFEWWSAIGPVTPARGFGPGGFIAGDHTEPTGALGGGMCSSSTTLFNAALRAGLQMGARQNHRYYINRYPLGLDATVSKTRHGSQTMSFTNDMNHPVVIRTFRYTAGGRGWVQYEIWGISDGRTVSIGRPSVSNVVKAVTETVYVTTRPHGEREQVEFPANGMATSVTRIVRRGGRVIHSDTYVTHYALWNGRIEIGR